VSQRERKRGRSYKSETWGRKGESWVPKCREKKFGYFKSIDRNEKPQGSGTQMERGKYHVVRKWKKVTQKKWKAKKRGRRQLGGITTTGFFQKKKRKPDAWDGGEGKTQKKVEKLQRLGENWSGRVRKKKLTKARRWGLHWYWSPRTPA